MKKSERFSKILDHFQRTQPIAETELHYENPFQLLVAVVLSAQCTDKRVNLVTKDLFVAFPDTASLAAVSSDEIFPYIRSVSYPNNKAKHLAGLGRMLMEDFNGEIPSDTEDLQKLPGVGRKTAHVVASVIFNKQVLPVDTHVFRVSARLGLTTRAKTVLETEKQLVKYIPAEQLPVAHNWLILHGRYVCKARTPLCDKCEISEYCAFFQKSKRGKASV